MGKSDEVQKLLATAIVQYMKANESINDEKVHQRALQMHAFMAQWTYPRDLVCMAVLSKKKEITQAIFEAAAENREEMNELMDQMVSIVLHLYGLAEARMEVELERKLKEAEEKEGGPRTHGQTKV